MKGERVWMHDHPVYGWTPAIIVSLSTNTNLRLITIRSQDNVERVVDPRSVIKYEEDIIDYNDMVQVQNLHEGILIHNVWQRFEKKKIYTWIGELLICVNPVKPLPELYTPTMLSSAHTLTLPHIYGTSAKAYKTMIQTARPQVFLVSGESGSGKTESCKLILQYLVHASAAVPSTGNSSSSRSLSLQNMILASSPILESFGNAKTKRNSNSSRFGKFFKIHFDNNGVMLGATISQFLLEKARVVQPPPGELNYSIFYTLVEGCDTPFRRALGLNPGVHNYKLLQPAGSSASGIDPVIESNNFRAVVASFQALGLEKDMQFVFEVLAAILHLGNVEFESHPHGGSAVVESRPLQAASLLLLGPTAERLALETALTTQLVSAGTNRKRGSVTRRLLEPHQSAQSRDALCKALYEALFDHICSLLNSAMLPDTSSIDPNNNRFIGILDIFGFENMDTNRYDQLLINYANEVLQLQFANQVILTEQQEYAKEQVPWTQVDFVSNQGCVDLLEKKPKGILPMLEEECMLPQGGDKRLLQKLHDMHEKDTSYTKPRLASDSKFGIRHYAGEVTYDIDGFVAQNRDDIHVDLVQLLISSAKQGVVKLGTRIQTNKKAATGASGTISSQFRTSLTTLLKDIGQTQPNHRYYIRCVKPNHDNTSAKFDPLFAQRQMRAMGMLETVRVRKMGYSLRITHQEFIDRFGCIIGAVGKTSATPKTICAQFLAKVLPPESGQSLWFMGTNKIFLKDKLVGTLEEMRYKAERIREEEEQRRREEELKKKRAEEERLRKLEEERRKQEEIEHKKKEEERKRHEEEIKKKKELLLKEEARLKEEIRLKEERAREQREKARLLEAKQTEAVKVPYLEVAKRGSSVLETPLPQSTNNSNNNNTTNEDTRNRISQRKHANDRKAALLPHPSRPTTPLSAHPSRPTTPSNPPPASNNINININNDSPVPINININIISNSSPDSRCTTPNGSQVNIGITPALTGSLPELLSSAPFLEAFEDFLKSTLDLALLEMWKDIQIYKKASERLLAGQARGIYNKYFGHGSKHNVNLDKKVLADLKDKIMYRNPEYATFARVEADILNSLLTRHITNFQNSGRAPQFSLIDTPNLAGPTTKNSNNKNTHAPAALTKSQSAMVMPTVSSSSSALARVAARVTLGRPESPSTSTGNLGLVPSRATSPAPIETPKELTPTEQGIVLFNENPKKGLEFLHANGIVQSNAVDIAKFFKASTTLDKTILGDFIGRRDELNQQVLGAFLATFEFQGMEFDMALREFLGWFRLPGESQMIERIVERFSKRYCESNPGGGHFANSEAAFILSYSIIMLATDLHNTNVKTKMTKEQWIKNNSGCNNGADFDIAFLKKIYERIAKTPFASTTKPALQKENSNQRISGAPPRSESKYGIPAFPLLRRGTTKPHVGK